MPLYMSSSDWIVLSSLLVLLNSYSSSKNQLRFTCLINILSLPRMLVIYFIGYQYTFCCFSMNSYSLYTFSLYLHYELFKRTVWVILCMFMSLCSVPRKISFQPCFPIKLYRIGLCVGIAINRAKQC